MCLGARRTREKLAGPLWFFIAAILVGHAGRQHRPFFLVRLDKLTRPIFQPSFDLSSGQARLCQIEIALDAP